MLWICANDGVPFSVGAPRCPECGSTEYRPEGQEDGPVYSTETAEPIEQAESADPDEGEADTAAKTSKTRKTPPR